MRVVIVPNHVRDAINAALDREIVKVPDAAKDREQLYSQIQSDVMFNFRSFMHFQKLRNDGHAQDEIHEIAQQMIFQVKLIGGDPFQYSLQAFGY